MPLSRITSASIANSAISAADIADGTITAVKIISVANTQITGNIVSSQITSVANTQITGNITAAQITSVANTQLTGLIQAAQIGSANATLVTSGTLPGARLPAGSVLQVVSSTLQPGSEITTTSQSFVDTGLSATITPTSATSKIFIVANYNAKTPSGNTNKLTLYRNSTTNLATGGAQFNQLSGASDYLPFSISFLDSPASTSATTYAVWFAAHSSGYTSYFGGQNYGGFPTLTITLMEIAA